MKNQFKTIVLTLLLAASLGACKKKDGGGGGVGVPECDDYLARMDACAKKTGSKGGEQLTKMAAMMRKAWKEDVADAEKKKAMPGACTTAIKDMKKQLPECDWGIPDEPKAPEGSAAPAEGSAGSAAPAPEGSAGSAAAPAGSAAP